MRGGDYRDESGGVSTGWCIFDNTARHAAWDDALQFLHALRALPDN
jgi:hypothetical protein